MQTFHAKHGRVEDEASYTKRCRDTPHVCESDNEKNCMEWKAECECSIQQGALEPRTHFSY